MKIAICEFHQETNSFTPFPSTRKDYEVFGIQRGAELIEKVDEGCALKGMIDVLQESDVDLVPAYRMWANAAGPVCQEVVDEFMSNALGIIRENLPLEGVCISLHGATQSVTSDDVCGDIVKAVREVVGSETVIAVTTDLHANITKQISNHADFVCGYHTYPHVDFYDVGRRAATLCIRKASGDRAIFAKHVAIPMIEPASGYTTVSGAFAALMQDAETLVKQGELIDFSIFQMQPWLDVCDGQTSVITYSEKADDSHAMALARRLVAMREELKPALTSVEDIIREAEKHDDGKPVVLVDSADSPNAGASGDSAFVLGEILRIGAGVRTAMALCCRPAATRAFELGIGGAGTFTLGASVSPKLSEPVTVKGEVLSLHDGHFIQEGPAKKGLKHNLGPTAVIKTGNTTLVITSDFLLGPGDMQLFRHFGVEPAFYQMVVVKACTSFRAAYEKITDRIYPADTPGAAASVLTRLNFTRLPKHFYPFAEISEADIVTIQ